MLVKCWGWDGGWTCRKGDAHRLGIRDGIRLDEPLLHTLPHLVPSKPKAPHSRNNESALFDGLALLDKLDDTFVHASRDIAQRSRRSPTTTTTTGTTATGRGGHGRGVAWGVVAGVAGRRTTRTDRRFRRGRRVLEDLEDPMAHLVDPGGRKGEMFVGVEGDEVGCVPEIHVNVGHDCL
jgi:hypothetical protein